jgi:FixJ family two-component response regulator
MSQAPAARATDQPIVFIIDDDESVRGAVEDLLHLVGLRVQTFGSSRDFLQTQRPDLPSCVVLDVRLPGPSGLEFQRVLSEPGILLPIIFISGYGDIPMLVRAMKSGAVEFLTKALREQELLDAVQVAVERDRVRLQEARIVADLQTRFASLTTQEWEVFSLVVTGRPNKVMAAQLNLSEMTVKAHRSQITRKMQAKSLVDLIRMADRLEISAGKP